MTFSFHHDSGTGISMYNDRIEIVRVRKHGGNIQLLSRSMIPFQHDVYDNGKMIDVSRFAATIKETYQAVRLSTKRITLCLPSSATVVRTLFMPKVNRKRMKELLDFQLRNDIRLPFADPVYDFDYFESDAAATETPILFVASPRELVLTLQQAFKKTGLRLTAIEPKGLSVLRSLRMLNLFPEVGTIVVEFEPERLDAHFYVNGVLRMTRSLDVNLQQYVQASAAVEGTAFGEGTLLERLDRANGIFSFATDLGYQLERWLSFFHYSLNQRNVTFQQIWITGQERLAGQLVEYLSSILTMKMGIIPALSGTEIDGAIEGSNLSAVGAAVRGIIPDAD